MKKLLVIAVLCCIFAANTLNMLEAKQQNIKQTTQAQQQDIEPKIAAYLEAQGIDINSPEGKRLIAYGYDNICQDMQFSSKSSLKQADTALENTQPVNDIEQSDLL